MIALPMRRSSSVSVLRLTTVPSAQRAVIPHPSSSTNFFSPSRSLAQVKVWNLAQETFPDSSFRSSRPPPPPSTASTSRGRPQPTPPDERTLKLGKTLRILQSHLPTLFASPLPQDILSPNITLHLFPSTHPHLPTASGRVAYHAALWTSPITWGRMPLVGNVRLDILSERMFKPTHDSRSASSSSSSDSNSIRTSFGGSEELRVRWRTCGKTKGLGMGAAFRGIGASQSVDKITEWLGGDARDDEEFCGIFVFDFDADGRILSHTIERAEEGRGSEGLGRVVSLADWLLGRAKGANGNGELQGAGLACLAVGRNEGNKLIVRQRERMRERGR